MNETQLSKLVQMMQDVADFLVQQSLTTSPSPAGWQQADFSQMVWSQVPFYHLGRLQIIIYNLSHINSQSQDGSALMNYVMSAEIADLLTKTQRRRIVTFLYHHGKQPLHYQNMQETLAFLQQLCQPAV